MYIIASDFDGTLCRNYAISDSDRRAIDEFRKAGNLFGIATGRGMWSYNSFCNDFGLELDFLVCDAGGGALDSNGDVLFEEREENRDGLLIRLAEFLAEKYDQWLGVGVDREGRIRFHAKHPEGFENFRPISEINDIKSFKLLEARLHTHERAIECQAEILRLFGDHLNPLKQGTSLDIVPVGVDKSFGVGKIAAHFGVSAQNVYTVGDTMNDAAMLEAFNGYCMADSADKQIFAYAKGEVESVGALIEMIMNK